MGMAEVAVIRRMTESDAASVAHLWYSLSKHHEDYHDYYGVRVGGEADLVAHVRDLFRRDCVVLVADLDGTICGFVTGYIVRRNPHLEIERVGKVDNIFVANAYRSRGLGTQLLERLFDFFKEQSIVYVEISCDIQNADAMRLYKRLGFAEQKTLLIKEL
jgi:ribosomal protein S18 acetylase RimI-like enzyme